jgi:hypothetical protein
MFCLRRSIGLWLRVPPSSCSYQVIPESGVNPAPRQISNFPETPHFLAILLQAVTRNALRPVLDDFKAYLVRSPILWIAATRAIILLSSRLFKVNSAKGVGLPVPSVRSVDQVLQRSTAGPELNMVPLTTLETQHFHWRPSGSSECYHQVPADLLEPVQGHANSYR